jgi:hypothetical protein
MAFEINEAFHAQQRNPNLLPSSTPISQIIKDGMRTVCEIDLLMLKSFFQIRE